MKPVEYLVLIGFVTWGGLLTYLAGFTDAGMVVQSVVLLAVSVLYLADSMRR